MQIGRDKKAAIQADYPVTDFVQSFKSAAFHDTTTLGAGMGNAEETRTPAATPVHRTYSRKKCSTSQNLAMSFFRSALRLCPRARLPRVLPSTTVRFNSTSNISLTAQIYPLEKNTITEQDVDKWLKAVETLKTGNAAPETPEEVYISQLSQPEEYLQEKQQPSAEQMEQVQRYQNKPVPILQDPVVQNLTHLIMRDGKKARAQKQVSKALYMVYLKLRQDPVQVLYETLDKLGPIFHTKVKSTGTAKSKTVPLPLNRRQRNRYAILWILEGAKKKKSSDFSVRLAEEIIGAFEGKSSGYDKKLQLHKNAIANRAYIEL